jgi:hypothetical protein
MSRGSYSAPEFWTFDVGRSMFAFASFRNFSFSVVLYCQYCYIFIA